MTDPSDFLTTFFSDTELNIIGISGLIFYLCGHYALRQRWCRETTLWNRVMRGAGLGCILLPLFLRWYLSASLLAAAGLMLTIASVYVIVTQRMRS